MNFIQGFFVLLAIAIGIIFAAFNFIVNWFLQTVMLVGAGIIIALDVFALLVWFVNWKYYPEQK